MNHPRVGSLSRHYSHNHDNMAKSAAEGMGSSASHHGSPNSTLKGGSGSGIGVSVNPVGGNGAYDPYEGHMHPEEVELAGTVLRKDIDLSDMYEREERERERGERSDRGKANDSLV